MYCCTPEHGVYNDRKEVWEQQDGTHIGLDFQTGTNGTFASRNWRCPTQGKYRIVFSAKCDTDTDVYVMLDNHITLYRNEKTNAVHYKRSGVTNETAIAGEVCCSACYAILHTLPAYIANTN